MYAKLAISSQQSLRETDVSEMAEESLENHRLKKPNQTKPNQTKQNQTKRLTHVRPKIQRKNNQKKKKNQPFRADSINWPSITINQLNGDVQISKRQQCGGNSGNKSTRQKLTLRTVRALAKSTPPCNRKPHG